MSDQQAQYAQSLKTTLLTNLMYTVILSIVIYDFASPHMSVISALLLAALPAAIYTLLGIIRYRRFNLLGVLALLSIAVKLISALLFKDAHLILISASLITGVNGIILLLSLFFAQPLLLVLARNMLANTPSLQSEQQTQRWQEPRHRAFFTLLTAIVGALLLIDFAAQIILVYTLTTAQFLFIGPIVHYSLLGILLLWIVLFVRHRRQGQQPAPIPQQEISHQASNNPIK